jgi:hypothetical protein
MEDTSPKAAEVYVQLHRGMTQGERIARIFELCDFQSALQHASVRAMYPHADENEVLLRVAARRFDRQTMIKAYGWDPELNP